MSLLLLCSSDLLHLRAQRFVFGLDGSQVLLHELRVLLQAQSQLTVRDVTFKHPAVVAHFTVCTVPGHV